MKPEGCYPVGYFICKHEMPGHVTKIDQLPLVTNALITCTSYHSILTLFYVFLEFLVILTIRIGPTEKRIGPTGVPMMWILILLTIDKVLVKWSWMVKVNALIYILKATYFLLGPFCTEPIMASYGHRGCFEIALRKFCLPWGGCKMTKSSVWPSTSWKDIPLHQFWGFHDDPVIQFSGHLVFWWFSLKYYGFA